MNSIEKPNSANSDTLKTTEKTRNVIHSMLDGVIHHVEDDLTEDAENQKNWQKETTDKDGDFSKTSVTVGRNQTEEEDDEDETQKVDITDLCQEENFISINPTNKLKSYSQAIFDAMVRTTKDTILLIGDRGSGKKTAVRYTAYRIATGNCPSFFVKHKSAVYEVDMHTLCEDEEGFISNINLILEHALAQGVKNVAIYFNDLANTPKVFIEQYQQIMPLLNRDQFESFKFILVYQDGTFLDSNIAEFIVDFFNENTISIEVKSEEQVNRILYVLEPRINELEKVHGVEFPNLMREFLLMCHYGRCFEKNFDYIDFLNVVDSVLARVKLSGRQAIIRNDIMNHYKCSFETMESLPAEYNAKTAIHESGHILLALMIPQLYSLYGCSILYDKKSGVEGVTFLKKTDYRSYTEDDEVKYVAMLLAGRTAEIEISKTSFFTAIPNPIKVNSGAECDLLRATEELRAWVIHSGAYRLVGCNIYNKDYASLPTVTKLKVDVIVNWLMKRAYNYARDVIQSNIDFIINMHKYLLRFYVATKADIKRIIRESNNNI